MNLAELLEPRTWERPPSRLVVALARGCARRDAALARAVESAREELGAAEVHRLEQRRRRLRRSAALRWLESAPAAVKRRAYSLAYQAAPEGHGPRRAVAFLEALRDEAKRARDAAAGCAVVNAGATPLTS